MNVTGIIAEYNPFHNGHAYQIAEARKRTVADYVIVILSGDFVQRGGPAIVDKYTRTRAALEGGADLVLMLPVTASTASAENFAASGVGILQATGVVTHLSFGLEASDAESYAFLEKCVPVLTCEPAAFQESLAARLKAGDPYPAARAQALLSSVDTSSLSSEQAQALLKEPNNILALEYLKQLSLYRDPIIPVPVARRAGSYHGSADGEIDPVSPSASVLRDALHHGQDDAAWQAAMPRGMADAILGLRKTRRLLCEDDFSQMLFLTLQLCIQNENKNLRVSEDLYRRIRKYFQDYTDWSSFTQLLKTKNITYTAVNRTLTGILLGITAKERAVMDKFSQAPYARILGFRKSAAPLLKEIGQNARIPVITKPKAAEDTLDPELKLLFTRDIAASELWRYASIKSLEDRPPCDYSQPLVIL